MGTLAPNLIEELRWRGLLYDITEGVEDVVKKEKIAGYIGFDPSADSLHVGSLLPIMVLVHMQRHGHTPIALVGGGTGMIGDPSGKTKERQLLSLEQIDHNLEGIHAQLEMFLAFEGVDNPAVMVNNGDWLRELNFIEFLRDVGKRFTVNYMLSKESVKTRLESEEGISFTEFCYMLLQSYDFLTLYRDYGCTFQFGGSDQWGNITAGAELIRKMDDGKAYGAVVPLVTSSTGVKFGKTEAGTVWLDPNRTSPYRFYQFWLNTADADAITYMKYFTLLDQDEVAEYEKAIEEAPHERATQKRLAEEVTRNVHGEEGLAAALKATEVLFGGELEGLSAAQLLDIFAEVPSSTFAGADLEGKSLVDLAVECGFESSKKRARTLIDGGGVSVNNEKRDDVEATISLSDAIDGQVIVLRKGKKKYHLVQVEG
ncbi:MAG: tyrosine--tRNA ligase [Anaerolineae bacterium]|nr:tyrosine--tRNA ligase [Anaerolineae bacterium]